jgi:hypothetical protein
MTYPNIVPGDDITDDLLNSMIPITKYKVTSEDRASTTTATLDSELFVTVEANAVYRVEIYIHYAAGNTGRLRTQWEVPTGSSGLRGTMGLDPAVTNATNAIGETRNGVHGFATNVDYGNRSSGFQALAFEEGIVVTTNPGTIGLMWCQASSDATNTTVANYSFMRVTRIG